MSKVEIDYNRYSELLKRERELEALEAGGVDNWEWYSESLAPLRKERAVEDLVDSVTEEVQCLIISEADISCEDSRNGLYIIDLDSSEITKILRALLISYDNIKEDFDEE